MKAHKNWSYAPYAPLFFESGNPYICQVAPKEREIFFAWLPREKSAKYDVHLRKRGEEKFTLVATTKDCSYTFVGLTTEQDYEFFVSCGNEKSRVRLARTGKAFGTTVNYLHPDDDAYSFSGKYLCSPSLVRHPDGFLLASMDLFDGGAPQNLTLIFRSDDEGKTWKYVSELFPAFWTKLFVHRGDLYALATSTEYGDLLIGKSTDGGATFGEPSVLLRGTNGKKGEVGIHKNSQPVVEFQGRLWNTFEWGSWHKGYHAMAVMSVPVDGDLLDPDAWAFSEPVKYDPAWNDSDRMVTGTIEGALAVVDGKLYDYQRFNCVEPTYDRALRFEVNTQNPESPIQFTGFVTFPASHSKFNIKYDEKRKKYYSVATRVTSKETAGHRNLLSLMVSDDCEQWQVERDIIDKRDGDPNKIGFQYVSFLVEGDEILFLCRTAINGAHSYHDSNYMIFERIKL